MITTSVIIPVYNTAGYLEECIDSVIAQGDDIEIILVDDGSDDGSDIICERYASEYPFIRFERQEHLFQGTARNTGLKLARGEYVYFMDSDDILKQGTFERCRAVCEDNDLDFVMFDAEGFKYDENDTELVVPEDIWDRSVLGIEDRVYTGREFWSTFYNTHGVLYVVWLLYIRRSFLIDNGIFFEERTYFEDNDWMLRAYLAAERTMYIPEEMHRHRWRRGSNMLDGFTVDLMKGCFRMHDRLLDIWSSVETPVEKRMVENVIRLNIGRFDRLAEIPEERQHLYSEPLDDFCAKLREKLNDDDEPVFNKYVEVTELERITEACSGWTGSFDTGYDRLSPEKFPIWLPARGYEHVVIYGTGKIGKIYHDLMMKFGLRDGKRLRFAQTDPEVGAEFCSLPVISISRAAEEAPDAVIVASTRFASEMEETARKLMPKTTEIYVVPAHIRFFL